MVCLGFVTTERGIYMENTAPTCSTVRFFSTTASQMGRYLYRKIGRVDLITQIQSHRGAQSNFPAFPRLADGARSRGSEVNYKLPNLARKISWLSWKFYEDKVAVVLDFEQKVDVILILGRFRFKRSYFLSWKISQRWRTQTSCLNLGWVSVLSLSFGTMYWRVLNDVFTVAIAYLSCVLWTKLLSTLNQRKPGINLVEPRTYRMGTKTVLAFRRKSAIS